MHTLCPSALLPIDMYNYVPQNPRLRMLTALVVISKNQVTTQRLMNNKKDQFWYSHPTEYYTPMKNKLSQRKCMSRTDITVKERNQTPMSMRGTIPCTPISNRLECQKLGQRLSQQACNNWKGAWGGRFEGANYAFIVPFIIEL